MMWAVFSVFEFLIDTDGEMYIRPVLLCISLSVFLLQKY